MVFFVLCLYVLGWRMFGISILDIQILSSIVILFCYFKSFFKYIVCKEYFIFSVLIFFALSMYVSLTTQGTDFSLIMRAVRVPLSLLSGIAFAIWLKNSCYSIDKVLYALTLVITINAVIALLMFLNEPFRISVYEITGALNTLNDTTTIRAGLRNPGLTYGLSQTSVFQSLGVLFGVLLLRTSNQYDRLYTIPLVFCILINIASCFIIGRTGLILSILFSFFLITNLKRLTVVLFLLLLLFLILSTVVGVENVEKFEIVFKRADEIILLLSGEQTQTTSALSKMYHVPEGVRLLYGGMGMGRSEYFIVHSDSGYIRLIYAFGILGMLAYLMLIFYLGIVYLKVRKFRYSILLPLFMWIFIVYSFKELFFYSRNVWQVVCLLLGYYMVNYYHRKLNSLEYW